MDILIEELVQEIKKEQRYLTFIKKEQTLQAKNVQSILKEYQEAVFAYQEIRQYKGYIDVSENEAKMKDLKLQISRHPVIQEYYESYRAINEVLEEVTKIVYNGISDTLNTSRYTF